jgi:hypothetical protein
MGGLLLDGGTTNINDISFMGNNVTIDRSGANFQSYTIMSRNLNCRHDGKAAFTRSTNYKVNESLWFDEGDCAMLGDPLKDLLSLYTVPIFTSAELVFDDVAESAKVVFVGNSLIPMFAMFELVSWDPVAKSVIDTLELLDYEHENSSITRYVGLVDSQWSTIIKV